MGMLTICVCGSRLLPARMPEITWQENTHRNLITYWPCRNCRNITEVRVRLCSDYGHDTSSVVSATTAVAGVANIKPRARSHWPLRETSFQLECHANERRALWFQYGAAYRARHIFLMRRHPGFSRPVSFQTLVVKHRLQTWLLQSEADHCKLASCVLKKGADTEISRVTHDYPRITSLNFKNFSEISIFSGDNISSRLSRVAGGKLWHTGLKTKFRSAHRRQATGEGIVTVRLDLTAAGNFQLLCPVSPCCTLEPFLLDHFGF